MLIQEQNQNKPKNTLLSEGAYGCIFKPGYTCQGKTEKKKYITKIQKKSPNSENELEIGKKIKKIKNYDLYFSPILKNCNLSMTNLLQNQKEIKQCELVKQEIEQQKQSQQNPEFQSNRIRYILGKTIGKTLEIKLQEYTYYQQQINNQPQNQTKHPFYFLLENHKYLLQSLSKLQKRRIIHYDMKQNNIMFDNQNNIPIIIDFGISIQTKKIDAKNPDILALKKIFYNDSEYLAWTLDIMFLSTLVLSNQPPPNQPPPTSWQTQPINPKLYQERIDVFLKESQLFKENQILLLSNLFPKESPIQDQIRNFQTNTKTLWENYLQTTLKPKTQLEFFQTLWENHKTWDTYALSTMFLFFVSSLPKPNDPKTTTLMENYVKKNIENIQNLPIARKTPLKMLKELSR
jgi:serine/threonine protein kinase